MPHGPWFIVCGPWFTVNDTRFTFHGSWSTVLGPRFMVHCQRYMVHVPRFMVHCPRSTVHGSNGTILLYVYKTTIFQQWIHKCHASPVVLITPGTCSHRNCNILIVSYQSVVWLKFSNKNLLYEVCCFSCLAALLMSVSCFFGDGAGDEGTRRLETQPFLALHGDSPDSECPGA